MHDQLVRRKTPWLDMPLVFSGNYREYECTLEEASQCEYQQGYWRFWYEADHRFALPTIAFFLAVIIVFSVAHTAGNVLPKSLLRTGVVNKTRSLFRYLSYRTIRIPFLNWNSAPVGVLLLAAIGTVFFFAMTLGPQPYYWPNTDDVDYGSSPPIATRAGWMGLACMPFVFATAGKANIITYFTGVSHERLQVFHRWISYAFFILALIHTFPFIVYNYQKNMMTEMWNEMVFYWTGVVALVAQAWLTFASLSPLRNLCYEWFKFSHYLAALIFVLFFFFHCDATLTAWDYFVATGVLFSLSWLYRHVRIYFEHGISHRAELSRASNGFIRVAIPTKTKWTVAQHYFIRIMGLGVHDATVHPFTACSVPSTDAKYPSDESELVFFIKPRGGFTARLASFIESNSTFRPRVLIDGPYGGVDPKAINDAHRMVVIAGGSGAGWVFPFITTFLKRLPTGDSKTEEASSPSLRVVLASRERATVSWFQTEVQQILQSCSMMNTSPVEIEIYYTGSGESERIAVSEDMQEVPEKLSKTTSNQVQQTTGTSLSPTSQSFDGQRMQHFESRPDLSSLIANEAGSITRGQTMSVFVCGPLSMQSDVANAVAREQLTLAKTGAGDIYLHLEHFSWA